MPGLVPYLHTCLVTLGGESLHYLKELQRIPSLSRLFGLSKLLLPVFASPSTTVPLKLLDPSNKASMMLPNSEDGRQMRPAAGQLFEAAAQLPRELQILAHLRLLPLQHYGAVPP